MNFHLRPADAIYAEGSAVGLGAELSLVRDICRVSSMNRVIGIWLGLVLGLVFKI